MRTLKQILVLVTIAMMIAPPAPAQVGSPRNTGVRNPFDRPITYADLNTVTVHQFGARCNGSYDDTDAFQRAANYAGPHKVLLPRATCKITSTVVIGQDRVQFKGAGPQISVVSFMPFANQTLFVVRGEATADGVNFPSGYDVNYESGISDIGISSADSTYQKIGIRLDDTSRFLLENVSIGSQFHGPGLLGAGTSIGLQIRGRELGTVKNVSFSSDQPISIESNPNTAQILDLDLWEFQGIYTLATGSSPHWKFASGIHVSNFTLTGADIGTGNGLGLGTGTGDYMQWIDSAPAPIAASFGFLVENARLEGVVGGTAYLFNIQKAVGTLKHVKFVLCSTGSAGLNRGWFLRGVSRVTLDTSYYTGTAEAFNCDSTCDAIRFVNTSFLGGSTITMTGMRQAVAYGRPQDSLEPIWSEETWISAANYGVVLNGSTMQSFVLELTNPTGAQVNHRIIGSHSDTSALGAYSGKLVGVSATAVPTPLVAVGTPFSVGGGIDSTNQARFIFDTAAQVNFDDYGEAAVELNSTGTAGIVVRPQNVNTNVGGVPRNRFGLVFGIDGTGVAFNLTAANIPIGTTLRVKFNGLIK